MQRLSRSRAAALSCYPKGVTRVCHETAHKWPCVVHSLVLIDQRYLCDPYSIEFVSFITESSVYNRYKILSKSELHDL